MLSRVLARAHTHASQSWSVLSPMHSCGHASPHRNLCDQLSPFFPSWPQYSYEGMEINNLPVELTVVWNGHFNIDNPAQNKGAEGGPRRRGAGRSSSHSGRCHSVPTLHASPAPHCPVTAPVGGQLLGVQWREQGWQEQLEALGPCLWGRLHFPAMFFCPSLFYIQKAEGTRLPMSHTEARTAFPGPHSWLPPALPPPPSPSCPLPAVHLYKCGAMRESCGLCLKAPRSRMRLAARAKGSAPSGSTARPREPVAGAVGHQQQVHEPRITEVSCAPWALSCSPAGP